MTEKENLSIESNIIDVIVDDWYIRGITRIEEVTLLVETDGIVRRYAATRHLDSDGKVLKLENVSRGYMVD